MGFLNKIKTILFEEDPGDEINLPPDYSKEEKEEEKKPDVVVEPKEEVKPVDTTEESRFKIKRDLEPVFDDEDILDEVAKVEEVKPKVVEEEVQEEKTTIFQAFDEKEFERSYSRLTRNEERARSEASNVEDDSEIARRANNNVSATSSNINNEDSKKFKPSPVLSPVFGILNVNYTKEDIVDKKDGIKRERVSPIIKRREERIVDEIKKVEVKKEPPKDETIEVDIDSVRKKAYGSLEDLEKAALNKKEEVKKEEVAVRDDFTSVELDKEEVEKEPVKEEPKEEKNVKADPIAVDDMTIEDVVEEHNNDLVYNEEEEEESKPVVLDELEKTSTLQILDDIEKELNAIKPISKEEVKEEPKVEEEIHDREPSVENSDTLENDLFNLIDSMYDTGEEKDNG